MQEVPYLNTGKHAVTIGTKTIMPGVCRMVDPRLLGKRMKAVASVSIPPSQTLQSIVDQLESGTEASNRELLMTLGDDQLEDVGDEIAEDSPISVLISEEWLRRENNGAVDGAETGDEGDDLKAMLDDSVDDIVAKLPGLSPGDLDQLATLEAAADNRVTLLRAIDVEAKARADADIG